MRLLLDEMHDPAIAVQLRNHGVDAIAIAERAELRGSPDDVVFAVARREGRALVTANVIDFRILVAACLDLGQDHPGVVFVNARRFPRNGAAGLMVRALLELAAAPPTGPAFEHWLQRSD